MDLSAIKNYISNIWGMTPSGGIRTYQKSDYVSMSVKYSACTESYAETYQTSYAAVDNAEIMASHLDKNMYGGFRFDSTTAGNISYQIGKEVETEFPDAEYAGKSVHGINGQEFTLDIKVIIHI